MGVGLGEALLLVLLVVVLPAVGIISFGLVVALLWRAVVKRDQRGPRIIVDDVHED